MRETSLMAAASRGIDPNLVSDLQSSLSLAPRQVPSRYLYDDLGSALFEAICHLPWYRVTRAEQLLLRRHAAAIVDAARQPLRIVELGSGNGKKLETLIERGWPSAPPLIVELVDVSSSALQAARQRLAPFDHVDLVTWPMSYERGLAAVAQSAHAHLATLVLFLGSNIGNFDPSDAEMFLRQVRAGLTTGDALLIGTDLVKPEPELIVAYDDPLGVTAAFNRNLLVRLNRDVDADFDLSRFAHRAVWNPEASRVEMHLVSLGAQTVRIPAADMTLRLEPGETIWTERSYKYRADEVRIWLADAGFTPIAQWCDSTAGFALTLACVV